MTIEDKKKWIDSASYQDLLDLTRNAPVGSQWFQGELGQHFSEVMRKKRIETPHQDRVAASKAIGW